MSPVSAVGDALPALLLVGEALALAATGALAAAAIGVRGTAQFVLAAYLVVAAEVVVVSLALSHRELVSRWPMAASVAGGLVVAVAVWTGRGRPPMPSMRRGMGLIMEAVRDPPLAVLAVAVALGMAYSLALLLFTPQNGGDVLTYHLARAAFWKQHGGIYWIASANDTRLNPNPPNAELGQLFTLIASGSDRFVGLVQFLSLIALCVGILAVARLLGIGVRGAVFGALVFAALPVVAMQASAGLNDLAVASFLLVAVVFAISPGRSSPALFALAVALALGTKMTAVLALPLLALVLVATHRGRQLATWAAYLLAGLVGGAYWYVVTFHESGSFDGGLKQGQVTDHSVSTVIATARLLVLGFLDLSGAIELNIAVYPIVALLMTLAALLIAVRRRWVSRAAARGALLVAVVPLLLLPVGLAITWAYQHGLLGLVPSDEPAAHQGWTVATTAGATSSWYGPVAPFLLVSGTVLVVVAVRRRQVRRLALLLGAAPFIFLPIMALTVVSDPYRGRFFMFAVALAAASWGVAYRTRAVAWAVVGMSFASLFLTLVQFGEKPTGIGLLNGSAPASIWGEPRWFTETVVRAAGSERQVLRTVEENVPADATIALAVPGDVLLSPYFGRTFGRRVELVSRSDDVPATAGWLVLAPDFPVVRCTADWARVLRLDDGWSVQRRLHTHTCQAD